MLTSKQSRDSWWVFEPKHITSKFLAGSIELISSLPSFFNEDVVTLWPPGQFSLWSASQHNQTLQLKWLLCPQPLSSSPCPLPSPPTLSPMRLKKTQLSHINTPSSPVWELFRLITDTEGKDLAFNKAVLKDTKAAIQEWSNDRLEYQTVALTARESEISAVHLIS